MKRDFMKTGSMSTVDTTKQREALLKNRILPTMTDECSQPGPSDQRKREPQ
jgi:hypothetical protein